MVGPETQKVTESLAKRPKQKDELGRARVATSEIVRTVNDMKAVRRFIKRALRKDVDYGKIPGTNRDFLLQPGAEKFCQWLKVRPVYESRETELDNFHLEVVTRCRLLTLDGREAMQSPECSSSTMETNFRFRWADVVPPSIVFDPPTDKNEQKQLTATRMARWLVTSSATRGLVSPSQVPKSASITAWFWQPRIPNPNVADERNKVRQISAKRSLVKAVRTLGALSEIFAEDPSEWGELEYEEETKEQKPSGRVKREAQSPPLPMTQPPAAADKPAESKKVTARWYEAGARLEGLTSGILDAIKERQCLLTWLESARCWVVPPDDVPTVAEVCESLGVEFEEIPRGEAVSPATSDAPRGPREKEAGPAAAGPTPGAGPVRRVKTGKTAGNSPYMQVLWKGIWCTCFDQNLFQWLAAALDKEADLVVDAKGGYPVVKAIKSIGTRQFDELGPVRTPNDEPGSLF